MQRKSVNFKQLFNFILLTMILLLPNVSLAHPNHLGYQEYFQGLLHPLTGLDHELAMIAVGILSFEKGRFWVWLLPLVFIAFMIIGGMFGFTGIVFPWFEFGITLSVLILGLCISFPNVMPSFPLLAIIAVFAACHGYAHGTEIPSNIRPLHYVLGFIAATGMLHLIGILIGKMLIPKQTWILRSAGFAMAMSIFWL
jgi:urease accessory protein